MTRKRLVKLLMANGYSRNSAQRMARLAPRAGYTYEEAFMKYKNITFIRAEIDYGVKNIKKAFRRIAKEACAAGIAFREIYANALTNESSDHAQEDE